MTTRRSKRRQRARKSRKRNTKAVNCSPKLRGQKLPFTCYTARGLHQIKTAWNLRHADCPITTNDTREIWEKLRTAMAETCSSEACWLRHECIKRGVDRSLLQSFAPPMPKVWAKRPDEWLTTLDIQRVMRQWERVRPSFIFLGPSPIDYDTHKVFDECVWEELCKFSLANMRRKGKSQIGVIFNLDPHYKGGSHWVALYIDTKKHIIYYFDSYGVRVPPRINKFIKMVKTQGLQLGNKYQVVVSKKRHQYSETECGMYCLYFIIGMLAGRNYRYFYSGKISDQSMLKLRNKYFNRNLKD